jgi:tetratricopeptide (TPR) repeat protein
MPSSFVFKSISHDSIPDALKKAERYRLLGDPEEAESVCLDILEADPGNQDALVDLILAISDQFRDEKRPRLELAEQYVSQLTDEYQRTYYTAVVMEREAGAYLHRGTPPVLAMLRYTEAMDQYARAEAIRPRGDDSAILRWNACVRAIRRRQLKPGLGEEEYVKPVDVA